VLEPARPVWLAVGPGRLDGMSPRLAVADGPVVEDLRGAARAHVAAVWARDVSTTVIDAGPVLTAAGAAAFRVLYARDGAVPLTVEHWVVGFASGSRVAAGAAPTLRWALVADQVRRALRSVRDPT
jgi:hypothetical protein